MRRIIPVLLFLFSVLLAKGQWNEPITQVSQRSFTSGVYGFADYGSTCLTNVFMANFFEGNYLNNSLKNEVSSQLQKFNRFGAELNYGMYGVFYNDTISKKRVCNFFFALRHKSYLNCTFSPDVFNLAFYGNAGYAGKTAQLMPFSLSMMNYQQAEIGLVCTNFNGKGEFGIGISFLAGHQLLAIDERKAFLYTDPTGQYLQFGSDAEAYLSDTSGRGKYINSYGASIDFYFKAPYKLGKHDGTITLSATDLGFLHWNRNSEEYFKDTSFYYDGVSINNISDLQNISFNGGSQDSIQRKYVPFAQKSFFHSIPSTLSFNSNTDYGKYHLELGYTYIFNANDIGYIYAQGDKYLPNGWKGAVQVGYGGFGTVNAAIMFSRVTLGSTFSIILNHIPGLIDPFYFGGAGLYIEYAHTFGK